MTCDLACHAHLLSRPSVLDTAPALLIADGESIDIRELVREARLPAALLPSTPRPLQAITEMLAQRPADVLHLVAHGGPGELSIGGTRIDSAALLAESRLLAGWPVRLIALWGCSVAERPDLPATLARLTGAHVLCADTVLGHDEGEGRWVLNRCFAPDGRDGAGTDFDTASLACAVFGAATLASWPHRLALVSAAFPEGFVGDVDGTNKAINAQYLSALGWTSFQFTQNSTGNVFVAQGNDIIGSVVITDANGVKHSIDGFIMWRAPSGSVTTVVFSPSETESLAIGGGGTYTISPGQYVGLTFNGQTLTISGGAVTGNAATNGLLDALNNYLIAQPQLSITDATVNEHDGTAVLTVALNTASADTVTVNYSTGDGTAVAGQDYAGATGSLTFLPGVTSQTITVNLLDDAIGEPTQAFSVTLADNSFASITDAIGVITITDDDGDSTPPVAPVITNVTELAGDPNAADLLSNDSTQVLTVTGEAGCTLKVYTSGGVLIPTGQYTVSDAAGTYTVDFGGNGLADGSYTVKLTDGAANESTASNVFVIDTTAPALPTVNALTTGSTTPSITGTATVGAGDVLRVAVNGVTYTEGAQLVRAGGNWTLTIPAGNALAGGTYPVSATVTDAAGNVATDATTSELVVDLGVTAGPLDMTNPTDTGTSPEDELTANGLPQLSFTGEPGLTVSLKGPDNTVLTPNTHYSVAYAGGTYTVTLLDARAGGTASDGFGTYAGGVTTGNPAATADGTYTLAATDGASNQATIGSFVIDTAAPAVPTVASQATASTTPSITGTATVGAGDVLRVAVNGVTYTEGAQLVRAGGNWTLTIPAGNALAGGTYPVTATVTDAAGNVATDATSGELDVNLGVTTGPLDMTDATDTGGSQDDEITAHGLPQLTFTGEPGLTLSLKGPDNTVLTPGTHYSVAYAAGSYTVTLLDARAGGAAADAFGSFSGGTATGNPAATADGPYTLSASKPGGSGIVGVFVIDTSAPAAPTVVAQTTNSVEPWITGTAAPGAGGTLTVTLAGHEYVLNDGHLTLAGGNWLLEVPPQAGLSLGQYTVTATAFDAAGNHAQDPTDTELQIVDSSLTIGPLDMTDATDTGRSQDDEVTGNGLPVLTFTGDAGLAVTLNGPDGTQLAPGTRYTVGYSAGTYTVRLLDARTGGTPSDPFGSFAAGSPTGNPASTADGVYTISVSNGQGKSGTVGSFTITTAPAAPVTIALTPDITPDDVINAREASTDVAITGRVGGAAIAGDIVTVTIDGRSFIGPVSNQAFSIAVPGAALAADPDRTVDARLVHSDLAGQTASATDVQSYRVDTTAPTITLDPIANDDALNAAELRAPLTIGGRTGGVEDGGVVSVSVHGERYSATVSHGAWSTQVPAARLAAFGPSEPVTADVSDAAGNPAPTAQRTVTLATGGPSVAISAISQDSGVAGDFITNDQTLLFAGTADPLATVTVSLDGGVLGTARADATGGWRYDHQASALTSGPHALAVSVVDAAGNTATANQSIRIDLTAPGERDDGQAPTITPKEGPIGGAGQPVIFTGTAEPDQPVSLVLDGRAIGLVTADGDGRWQFPYDGAPLDGGPHTLVARVTDPAGNASSVERELDVFSAALDPASDDGVSDRDTVTSVISPQFRLDAGESLVAGRSVRLVGPDGLVVASVQVSAQDAADGSVRLTAPDLDDGLHGFTAQLVDADGRQVAQSPVSVTVVTDLDGVMPSVERAAHGGDFNRDGIGDWEQNNVAQLPLRSVADFRAGREAPAESFGAILAGTPDPANAGSPVRLDTHAQLRDLSIVVPPTSAATGGTVATPAFQFTVGGQAGSSLTDLDPSRDGLQTRIVIDLAQGVQANAYLKEGADGSWSAYLDDQRLDTLDDGATLLDLDQDGRIDRIVVTLTDGAAGDADGLANGTVVDPGVLVYRDTPAIPGGSANPSTPATPSTPALPGGPTPAPADPVYSVRLANGDRYLSTDAGEAAAMAAGPQAVFEGVRFDSLPAAQGGALMQAWHQPFTTDWFFGPDAGSTPYSCYELVPVAAGFRAGAPDLADAVAFHLFLDSAGQTQLLSLDQARALGAQALGLVDQGARFATTLRSAYDFDPEAYLIANRDNAGVRQLVQSLSARFQSTADPGFQDAVEQDFLAHQAAHDTLLPGGTATTDDLNAVYGTVFFG